ncbi:MAG: phosphoribosylglycinamide formyltransferase [Gudongella sp.]|nr:phosphoribosylglycinamide formyltransferase [Gudongella sp.]
MPRKKIGVLISGGGTNLQAVIDACSENKINAETVVVISNKEHAFGLKRAEKAGIDALYIAPKLFSSSDYDLEIIKELKKREVDLIVLAGFLRVLSPIFINAFRDKIINIHPSLIPEFCGDGYYGEKVHQAVLDSDCKLTGATVHFVDEGTDTGEIILQESVDVLRDDTVESLQKRVLRVEHKILVKALHELCNED